MNYPHSRSHSSTPTATPKRSHTVRVAAAASLAAILSLAGCAVPELVGGMAQSAYLEGSTTFPAEYTGLEGETWAVVTLADRGITSEVFNIQTILTNATTGKLVAAQMGGKLGSDGYVPGPEVLVLQTGEPTFDSWTFGKMAEELGVSRLVVIDIASFRLHEPGNRYLWDGRVAARVGVVEADLRPDEFAYVKDFNIAYPDDSGRTQQDFSRGHVVNVLLDRLSDRAAWLFFEHDEPNVIKY